MLDKPPALETLIKSGRVNIEAKDIHGKTALHYMVDAKIRIWLRAGLPFLIKKGNPQIDAIDNLGNTALHIAAAGNYSQAIHILFIESNPNVNALDKSLDTPLHAAIICKQLENVRILIEEYNASLNIVNLQGFTPWKLLTYDKDFYSPSFLINALTVRFFLELFYQMNLSEQKIYGKSWKEKSIVPWDLIIRFKNSVKVKLKDFFEANAYLPLNGEIEQALDLLNSMGPPIKINKILSLPTAEDNFLVLRNEESGNLFESKGLPLDIICIILAYLSPKELLQTTFVNKYFNKITAYAGRQQIVAKFPYVKDFFSIEYNKNPALIYMKEHQRFENTQNDLYHHHEAFLYLAEKICPYDKDFKDFFKKNSEKRTKLLLMIAQGNLAQAFADIPIIESVYDTNESVDRAKLATAIYLITLFYFAWVGGYTKLLAEYVGLTEENPIDKVLEQFKIKHPEVQQPTLIKTALPLYLAATMGNLSFLQEHWNQYIGEEKQFLFKAACAAGQLKTAQWIFTKLHNQAEVMNFDCFMRAIRLNSCRAGAHLDITQFLLDHAIVSRDSIMYGWPLYLNQETIDAAYFKAVLYNQKPLIKILKTKTSEYGIKKAEQAVENDDKTFYHPKCP